MANVRFNIAKGKFREYHDRVANNDPVNAALVWVALNTSELDANLIDLDNLSLVLANASTIEVTNAGYARIVLSDVDLTLSAPDDANDRVDLDHADIDFGAITAGDDWTDLLLCYDADTTGGTDANLIPMGLYDFAVSPNGSTIQATLNAQGYVTIP